jgi:hypothetical protein
MAVGGLLSLVAFGCGEGRHGQIVAPGPPPLMGTGAAAGAGGMSGNGGEGGVRLQAHQLEADGTEPLVLGIFDTRKHAECEFLLDSEGQLRCLPLRVQSLRLWETGDGHEDQNCAYLGDPAVLKDFKLRPVSLPLPRHGCEQRYVVASISISTEPGPPGYSVNNVCAEEPPAFGGPVYTPVTIYSVLPPEEWVAATRVDGPRLSERLRLGQFSGEDGSTFDDQVHDEKWGTGCTLAGTADSQQACVPPSLPFDTRVFADDACTTPLWTQPACAPETYISAGSDSLGQHPARALGEPYTGQLYGIQGHGSRVCTPRAADSGRTGTAVYYQGGQAVEEPWAPFSWQLQGTGRLQRRGVTGADGTFIPVDDWLIREPSRYHDTVTGADCNPVRTAGAGTRCVPTGVLLDPTGYDYGFYADAQCSVHAYFCYLEGCDIGRAVVMETAEGGERLATSLVHTTRLMSAYNKTPEGACVFNPAAGNVVTLGEPASWDELPQLTERNGPASSAP